MDLSLRAILTADDAGLVLQQHEQETLTTFIDYQDTSDIAGNLRAEVHHVLERIEPRDDTGRENVSMLRQGCETLFVPLDERVERIEGCSQKSRNRLRAVVYSRKAMRGNRIPWQHLKEPEDWVSVTNQQQNGLIAQFWNQGIQSIAAEPYGNHFRQKLAEYRERTFQNDLVGSNQFLHDVLPHANVSRIDYTIDDWRREYMALFAGQSAWSIAEWPGGKAFISAFNRWRHAQTVEDGRRRGKPLSIVARAALLHDVFPVPRKRHGCPSNQEVGFDSPHERAIGLVLKRLGLLPRLREGQNVHVFPSQFSESSVDFRLQKANGKNLWLEFHPANRQDEHGGMDEVRQRKGEGIPPDEEFFIFEMVLALYDILQQEPFASLLQTAYGPLSREDLMKMLQEEYRRGYEYDLAHPVQRRLFETDESSEADTEESSTAAKTTTLAAEKPERGAPPPDLRIRITTDFGDMSPGAQDFFRNRPYLTKGMCTKWGIGYAPNSIPKPFGEYIVYPFYLDTGECIWIRRNPKYEEQEAACFEAEQGTEQQRPIKYLFPGKRIFEKGNHLWGEYLLPEPGFRERIKIHGLTIVEGMNGVVGLDWHDIPALAVCAAAMTERQAEKIADVARELTDGRVRIMFDCNSKGESGAAGAAERLKSLGMEPEILWSSELDGGRYEGLQPDDLRRVDDIRQFFPTIAENAIDIPEEHPGIATGAFTTFDKNERQLVPF